MEAPQYRFDLSGRKGCSIQSVVIRETNGQDEELAAQHSKAKGNTSYEELIRLSITHVNDKPVEQPFLGFAEWNTRTRSYVLRAFESINGIPDKEASDFLTAAVPLKA